MILLWILILRFWVEMFSLINLIFLTDENYFSISNPAKTITVAFNDQAAEKGNAFVEEKASVLFRF